MRAIHSTLPVFGLLYGLISSSGERRARVDDPDFQHRVRPFLQRHCYECHSGEQPEAGLDLSYYAEARLALEEPDEWLKLHEQLVTGEMPPKGHARPGYAEREGVLGWIESRFEFELDDTGPIDPGRPTVRRLNHTEYRNTVRDLFGVDYPAEELFPSEGIGFGFDTVGDALTMSGLSFEKYLDAAEFIAGRAIVLPEAGPPRERHFGVDDMHGDGRPSETGWLLFTNGDAEAAYSFPRDGEYLLRVSAWAQQAGPELARMGILLDGRNVGEHKVAATERRAEVYVAQVRVSEGRHRVGGRFKNDFYRPENPDKTRRDRNLIVEWIEVVGPLDPPTTTAFQGELFERFDEPLGRNRLQAILEHLAVLAWRRPIDSRELGRLVRHVEDEEGLEAQVQFGLQVILSSPRFLFKIEPDPTGPPSSGVRELDDHELATRLSYFLWSTTPDSELRALAERGALVSSDVLIEQTARMLADPRSRALADNFAAQWLQVRNLDRVAVDAGRFPEFDAELRAAMTEETLSMFDALLREEGSVWELLESDSSFLNERLAQHYGVQGVYGEEMRRVDLSHTPRRGVLGHASVLTVTSDPSRTSPVKRGKWILETLLGAPPPPPPPGADSLDESEEASSAASLRERLELHRADQACAVCHDVLDPLGFGLENYDAIGAWRDADGSFPIDASGVLPDGRAFDGPRGLVEVLRSDDDFLRAVVERLLVYALGRGLERSDRRTIEGILAALDADRPTLRAMIEALILSDAFRKRHVGGL